MLEEIVKVLEFSVTLDLVNIQNYQGALIRPVNFIEKELIHSNCENDAFYKFRSFDSLEHATHSSIMEIRKPQQFNTIAFDYFQLKGRAYSPAMSKIHERGLSKDTQTQSSRDFQSIKNSLYNGKSQRENAYINNTSYFKLYNLNKKKTKQSFESFKGYSDIPLYESKVYQNSKLYNSIETTKKEQLRQSGTSQVSFRNSRFFQKNQVQNSVRSSVEVQKLPQFLYVGKLSRRRQRSSSLQDMRDQQLNALKDVKQDIDGLKAKMVRQRVYSVGDLPELIHVKHEPEKVMKIQLDVKKFQQKVI